MDVLQDVYISTDWLCAGVIVYFIVTCWKVKEFFNIDVMRYNQKMYCCRIKRHAV